MLQIIVNYLFSSKYSVGFLIVIFSIKSVYPYSRTFIFFWRVCEARTASVKDQMNVNCGIESLLSYEL